MKKSIRNKVLILIILLLIGSFFIGCSELENIFANESTGLKVHFIDVGQGDSILIQDEGASLLIDAGDNGKEELLVDYIKKQRIETLNHVIGTHPHSDHIGGLDAVLEEFTVENFYMPKLIHNTKTFEDVIKVVKKSKLKITEPIPGKQFLLDTAEVTILAPNSSSYSNLNNYSIVVKVDYGNTSFLFTGDAEELSEEEMLEHEYDLSSDVLKVAHHGSNTSTSPEFLQAVNPRFAVISVGIGNRYGLPDNETIEQLKERNIKVYRTDEDGTVIATSDGENINFQ